MIRFDAATLRPIALQALEEAFAAAQDTPARSWGARLALACVAHGEDDRRPFDMFWQALANPNDVTRRAMLLSSYNAIRRRHGLDRR